ncbi:cytochrome P450 [Pseudomonas brassicacearum]|uniref:cytochrome P450 n=1 Tax=Pseudomonas brassicacearum TaxID=930166 RepID=UPI00042F147E|nr:cytochrome P450 [Pseudomonas brassicacearum]AHL34093.1 cytochrome P450 [Pseudomonas brassicacearum]
MPNNPSAIATVKPSAAKYAQLGFLKIAESACRQHGDKVWIGEEEHAVLLLAGARHLRFFLENESSFHKELDNGASVRRLLLGQSLITAREGEEWHLARKLTTPLVNPKSALLKQGTRLSAQWLVDTLHDPEKNSMQEICLQWALMCVAQGFVGSRLGYQQLDELINHFRRIYLQLIVAEPNEDYAVLSQHPALIAFRETLESMIGPLVTGVDAGDRDVDMLVRFCQALDVSAHPQERERAISLLLGNLVASVDNTGIALLWCLAHLSQHPHYQDQVREESCQGKRDMAIAIVKESLRITPVTAFFERGTLDPLEIDGVGIPAGTKVLFSPWLVHRNAVYWPEPLSFRPERFLEGRKIPREHFVPFSMGKRNCVGMALALDQLTTAVEALCSHCRFSLAPSTTPAALTPLYGLNVMPRGPICFTIESVDRVSQHECIA